MTPQEKDSEATFDDRLDALDIHCSGVFHDFVISEASVYSFVRMRKPAPTPGMPSVFFVHALDGKPQIHVTVYGNDEGEPVWRFAPGDEVYNVEDFIVELDKRLPQLPPKEGAS